VCLSRTSTPVSGERGVVGGRKRAITVCTKKGPMMHPGQLLRYAPTTPEHGGAEEAEEEDTPQEDHGTALQNHGDGQQPGGDAQGAIEPGCKQELEHATTHASRGDAVEEEGQAGVEEPRVRPTVHLAVGQAVDEAATQGQGIRAPQGQEHLGPGVGRLGTWSRHADAV
jgi:hypothetical protein